MTNNKFFGRSFLVVSALWLWIFLTATLPINDWVVAPSVLYLASAIDAAQGLVSGFVFRAILGLAGGWMLTFYAFCGILGCRGKKPPRGYVWKIVVIAGCAIVGAGITAIFMALSLHAAYCLWIVAAGAVTAIAGILLLRKEFRLAPKNEE